MAVRIYFSHRMETLARHLGDGLQAATAAGDLFQAPRVIVPNPNIKRWLQLQIAEQHGIAANIQFSYLQDGMWEALAELHDQAGDEPRPVHLSPEPLQLMILSFLTANLRRPTPVGRALEPIAFMLYDADGQRCRNHAQRLWQLAGQLSVYLREYEFHRHDMIAAWHRGDPGLKAAATDAEVRRMTECQRAVYLGLFGSGGLRDQAAAATGERLQTLPQYADFVLSRRQAATGKPESLHVFGLSQMSTFRRDLLLKLGHFYDVHIYQFNVCSEFWEDVTTPREDRWARIRAAATTTSTDGEEELAWDEYENMLLKWCGKPGRENIRLLGELEERAIGNLDVQSFWLEPEAVTAAAETVLETVQQQVLTRSQADPEDPLPQDRSIQIAACPGIYREVESVYNSIIDNLRRTPELSPSDIAILVPDVGTYKPVINSVFGRQPAPVGYNLTDSTASQDSAYAQTVTALLALAQGHFTRKEVFELVLSPCFLAAQAMPRDEAMNWVRWAEQLGVFHSFDADHKARNGLPANPLFTWQQGLRRLRLGRVMTAADTGEPFAGVAPFEDMASGDAVAVGRFGLVIELLFQRLQGLATTPLTGADWAARLQDLLETFVGIPESRPEEAAVRRQVLNGLDALKHLDVLLGLAGGADRLELGFILEFMQTRLAGIPSRRGSYLSGGVTISELRPNRAVPFELVYVLGLGEGNFPGRADHSTLDLRRPGRRLGDINRPEEDRYVFLETLMCTRAKLYLTYISRDLQRDQICHPGSLVVQLSTYLERCALHRPFHRVEVPLKGSSQAYLRDNEDWQDLLVNYATGDRLLCLQRLSRDSKQQLPDALQEELAAAIQARMLTIETLPAEVAEDRSTIVFSLRDIERFLRNPLEAGLRRLQLYEWEDGDPALAQDEPFFSEARTEGSFVNDVLAHYVRARSRRAQPPETEPDAYEDYFARTYAAARLRSETPDGAFAELDRNRIQEVIRERIEGRGMVSTGLAELLADLQPALLYDHVTIGNPGLTGAADLGFPPLELKLDQNRKVEIHGAFPLVWRHPDDGAVELLAITRGDHSKGYYIPSRQFLSPFLFYVAARCGCRPNGDGSNSREWFGEHPVTIHVASRYRVRTFRYLISPETATQYLKDIVLAMLGPEAFDMLPFELFTNLGKTKVPLPYIPNAKAAPREKNEFARRLQLEVNEAIDNPWSSWYPSPLISLTEATVPADAWDKVHQRFPLFFDAIKTKRR